VVRSTATTSPESSSPSESSRSGEARPPPPRSSVHPALRRSFSFDDLPALSTERPAGVADPGISVPITSTRRRRGPFIVRDAATGAYPAEYASLVAPSKLVIPPRNLARATTPIELHLAGNAFAQAEARERAREPTATASQATSPSPRQVRFAAPSRSHQTPRRARPPPVRFPGANPLFEIANEADEPTEVEELGERSDMGTQSSIEELLRLAQAIETPLMTTRTPQSEFNWSTASYERRRRGTVSAGDDDAGPDNRSRLRQFARDVFTPHPDSIPQGHFSPLSPRSPALPPQQDNSTVEDRLSAQLDDAIATWTRAAPEARSDSLDNCSSVYSQDSYRHSISRRSIGDQLLRKEMGLGPLRNRSQDEPKHPKHEYEWNTTKLMCWGAHTQHSSPLASTVADNDPPNTASAHANTYAIGSPYDSLHTQTSQSQAPLKCANCDNYCCHYVKLLTYSEERLSVYNIGARSAKRTLTQACETMRARKPNGSEEYETFLKCGQCDELFCPRCISFCSEQLCRDPTCVQCLRDDRTGRCWIHYDD